VVESTRFHKLLEEQYENPFDQKKFQEMPEEAFDSEVNNLIEWCEDLDYDKYIENWFQLATSSQQEVTADDSAIRVYKAGMGEITIGLNEKADQKEKSF
jgi:hypothetical protein